MVASTTSSAMKYILLLLLAVVCLESCAARCVKTQQGRVNGTQMTSRNGRKILEFRGIPYGEPPIGNLRFRDPVPKGPWSGSLNVQSDKPECAQRTSSGMSGSEDCLYLNVFTPETKPARLLKVLIYLYDGSFQHGNASQSTTSPTYLLDKDVVLVTFNYRVGVLGWMSTGDLACPGNFGLKDAVLVLQWVQNNIAAFGGDRNEVTIFGHDAGGEMVHHLMLADKSKPLFKRAIQQSAVTPLNFAGDPSYYDKPAMVAQQCNCPTNNSMVMVECLRRRDAADLINTTVFTNLDRAVGGQWRPTKEPQGPDALVLDTPANAMGQGKLKNCPLISGTVKDEATGIMKSIIADAELYQQCVNDPVTVITQLLLYSYFYPFNQINVTALAVKVKNYYLGETMPTDMPTIVNKYQRLISDCLYKYPHSEFQDTMSQNHPDTFYVYDFRYRGALSFALGLGGKLGTCGVGHGDDHFYLFPLNGSFIGPQYSNIQLTPKDGRIIDLVIDLWTSFASTGVPVSSRLDVADQWRSYRSRVILDIGDGTNTTSGLRPATRSKNIQFWYENMPANGGSDNSAECD